MTNLTKVCTVCFTFRMNEKARLSWKILTCNRVKVHTETGVASECLLTLQSLQLDKSIGNLRVCFIWKLFPKRQKV